MKVGPPSKASRQCPDVPYDLSSIHPSSRKADSSVMPISLPSRRQYLFVSLTMLCITVTSSAKTPSYSSSTSSPSSSSSRTLSRQDDVTRGNNSSKKRNRRSNSMGAKKILSSGHNKSNYYREGPFHPFIIRRILASRCNGLRSSNLPWSGQHQKLPSNSHSDEENGGYGGAGEVNENRKDIGGYNNNNNSQDRRGCGIWIYRGYLSDPFTGRCICPVEGLELTRCLTEMVHPAQQQDQDGYDNNTNEDKKEDFDSVRRSRCTSTSLGDLNVKEFLFPFLKSEKGISIPEINSGGIPLSQEEEKDEEDGTTSLPFSAYYRSVLSNRLMNRFNSFVKNNRISINENHSPDQQQLHRRLPPPQQWDYSGTMLSRKLFCYLNPSNSNDNSNVRKTTTTTKKKKQEEETDIIENPSFLQNRLLNNIPLRGSGSNKSQRQITMNEAVTMYDSATTYITRNNGKEMILITEFPNRQCIVSSCNNVKLSVFDAAAVDEKRDDERRFFDTSSSDSFTYSRTNSNHEGSSSKSASGKRRKGKARRKELNDKRESVTFFDFTTYGRIARRDIPLSDIIRPLASVSSDDKSELISSTSEVAPPRSRWIQFGPEDKSIQRDKYGARETYSFSNLDSVDDYDINDLNAGTNYDCPSGTPHSKKRCYSTDPTTSNIFRTGAKHHITSAISSLSKLLPSIFSSRTKRTSSSFPTVKYTRYGECPPWYGPNKMCTLELVGRRIDSLADAPPLCTTVASQCIPGFTSVKSPVSPSDLPTSHGDDHFDWDGISNNSISTATGNDVNAMEAITLFRKDALHLNVPTYLSFPTFPHPPTERMVASIKNVVAKIRLSTVVTPSRGIGLST